MALEKDFQAKVVRWLKSKDCVVIKYQQNATTRAGVPDLIFLKDGFWGALEVKKAKNAPFRPGQKQMVEKLDSMSWAKVVYPENYDRIKKELEEILR